MKQLKSRLLTAGLATAIIAANAAGAVFAFQADNSVPSYQSTPLTATAAARSSATVAPENGTAISQGDAVSIAKEAVRNTFDVSPDNLYPVAIETEYEEIPVWYVSLMPSYNLSSLDADSILEFDCYSVYLSKETGDILDITNETVVVSGPSVPYQVSRESKGDGVVSFAITDGDLTGEQQENASPASPTTIAPEEKAVQEVN